MDEWGVHSADQWQLRSKVSGGIGTLVYYGVNFVTTPRIRMGYLSSTGGCFLSINLHRKQ